MTKNQLQLILLVCLQYWTEYRQRNNQHHISSWFNVNFFDSFSDKKYPKISTISRRQISPAFHTCNWWIHTGFVYKNVNQVQFVTPFIWTNRNSLTMKSCHGTYCHLWRARAPPVPQTALQSVRAPVHVRLFTFQGEIRVQSLIGSQSPRSRGRKTNRSPTGFTV